MIASGALAPSVVLGDSQSLPIQIAGVRTGKQYVSRLTFKLPATLANGSYSLLVTVHDSDGHLDQWLWHVTVGTSPGHGDHDHR